MLKKNIFLMLSILIIYLVFYIHLNCLNVPLERDEGEYAYMAQLILEGIPPYSIAYNMKLPGTYFMYAIFMLLFGQSIIGIRLGFLILNLITIFLVFIIARKKFNVFVGYGSAVSYSVLSIGISFLGLFAHATHFVVFFALSGIYMMLIGIENYKNIEFEKSNTSLKLESRLFNISAENIRILFFFFSGIFLGLSFLMKQNGLFFIFFSLLYLFFEFLKKKIPFKNILINLSVIIFGSLLPFLIIYFYLWNARVTNNFLFWVFDYGIKYASIVPVSYGMKLFLYQILKILNEYFFLTVFIISGLILILFKKNFDRIFIILLFLFSFISVCPGLYFREHYFILILPAASILIAIFLDYLRLKLDSSNISYFTKILVVLIILISFCQPIYLKKDIFFESNPDKISRIIYGANPFPESIAIGNYIKENTKPDDMIAILGSEPQIFFYSKRHSATGYIYMYALMENQKYAMAMQRQMIQEIEKNKPKFLIFVKIPSSWLITQNSNKLIFIWFNEYVNRFYKIDKNLNYIYIFKRI